MKHLSEFEKNNTSKKLLNIINRRYINMNKLYDVKHDKFLRKVICSKKEEKLTVGKPYNLYAEFNTGAMLSGKCFVVFDNTNNFVGYDSDYFLEEYQWYSRKYNL
jgi:hypothetical protein